MSYLDDVTLPNSPSATLPKKSGSSYLDSVMLPTQPVNTKLLSAQNDYQTALNEANNPKSPGILEIAKNVPSAMLQIAKSVVAHPVQTTGSVLGGLYDVGPTIVNSVNNVGKAMLTPILGKQNVSKLGVQLPLPGTYANEQVGNTSDAQNAIRNSVTNVAGYELGGALTKPLLGATKILPTGEKILADTLSSRIGGNVVGGQLTSQATTLQDRAKQAALDTSMALAGEGLSAGLGKIFPKEIPKTEAPKVETPLLAKENQIKPQEANSGMFANIGPRSFSDTGSYRANSEGLTKVADQVYGSLSKTSTVPDGPSLYKLPKSDAYLNGDFPSVIRSLYTKAGERANEFSTTLKENGIDRASINIKEPQSFIDKAVKKAKLGTDYASNPNDLVRGTVVVPNEQAATALLAKFGDKVATFDNYFEKPNAGYKGINADLRLKDGSLAELQIHTPESLQNAERLHDTEYKPRSVTGTGETKVRGLSQGVETKAIENKLTKSFGDLPEYKTVSMKDQANQASKLIESDYESAKKIAMGEVAPPHGVLPESVFVAVENKAIKEGDVATLRELATNSNLTSEATTMGQRIRTLAERDPESPVGAMNEIAKTRIKANESKVKTEVEIIKNKIPKVPKETWASFIDSVTC